MTHPIQSAFKEAQVLNTFNSYPDVMKEKLLFLRELIFEVALENQINDLDETLKWGEPSYLTKKGSTIRLAWRKPNPESYAMFFNCKTSLVETFKEVYGSIFTFEGNRAIVFRQNDKVPELELKHCIELSLKYKSIKNLPLLGL